MIIRKLYAKTKVPNTTDEKVRSLNKVINGWTLWLLEVLYSTKRDVLWFIRYLYATIPDSRAESVICLSSNSRGMPYSIKSDLALFHLSNSHQKQAVCCRLFSILQNAITIIQRLGFTDIGLQRGGG